MSRGLMVIEFSSTFLRQLKKLDLQKNKKLEVKMLLFSQNPFHPQLKTHKLSGRLEGKLAFSLAPNLRVVFEFIDESTALFLAIGSHDQVYR